ncbi:MAG: helix-turn-helix transcriptional regulator [Bacteroidetes bacterium]|nr:helix-turn-helix transcriptional regulator [Bacteroidota bacterium]
MALHIGKLVRQHLEEVGMTKSEFARRIGTSPQNIYGIFKRKSCDTELLREISRVLNFDFFQYYSTNALVVEEKNGNKTSVFTAADLKKELELKTRELDVVRSENEYLKEIHRLMKERTPVRAK